jgi:hypothetical protein
MDIDFWTKELTAVEGAPVLFGLALIVIGGVIWRLISWAYERQITNLKSDAATLERQLAEARTKEGPVTARVEKLEAIVQVLHKGILAGTDLKALAGTSASAVSTVTDLTRANNELSHSLTATTDLAKIWFDMKPKPTKSGS